jgi:hypothetical protein
MARIPVISESLASVHQHIILTAFPVDTDPGVDDVLAMFVIITNISLPI